MAKRLLAVLGCIDRPKGKVGPIVSRFLSKIPINSIAAGAISNEAF